jgi:hypothetical protein
MATLQKQQIDPAQPQMPPPAPPRAATMQQQQALSGVPTPPAQKQPANQMTQQLDTAMQMSKPLTAQPATSSQAGQLSSAQRASGATKSGAPADYGAMASALAGQGQSPAANVNPQTAAPTVAPPSAAPPAAPNSLYGSNANLADLSDDQVMNIHREINPFASGMQNVNGQWTYEGGPIDIRTFNPRDLDFYLKGIGSAEETQGSYDPDAVAAFNAGNHPAAIDMASALSGVLTAGQAGVGNTINTHTAPKPYIPSPSIDPNGGVSGPPSTGTGSGVPGGGSIDPTTGVPPVNPATGTPATGTTDLSDLLYDSNAEMDDYLSQGNQVISDQMEKRRADQMRMLKERAVARGMGTGDSPIDFETDELTSQLSREEREARFDLLDRSQGLDIQRDQMAQQSKFFAAQFGMDEKKLAEDTRRFGLQHALQQQGMDRDEAFRYAQMAQDKGLASRGLDISEMQAKGQLNQQQLQFMMSLMNVMDPEDLKKLGLDKVFANALLGGGGLGGGSNGGGAGGGAGGGGGLGTPETRQQQRDSIKSQIADIDTQLASGNLSPRDRAALMAKKQELQNNLNQMGE